MNRALMEAAEDSFAKLHVFLFLGSTETGPGGGRLGSAIAGVLSPQRTDRGREDRSEKRRDEH